MPSKPTRRIGRLELSATALHCTPPPHQVAAEYPHYWRLRCSRDIKYSYEPLTVRGWPTRAFVAMKIAADIFALVVSEQRFHPQFRDLRKVTSTATQSH